MDTPMMKQYYEAKRQHQDKFVFFRMGDFFEMFDNDAVEASNILGITLTKRADVTMCGIPCKAYDIYVKRLLRSCSRQIAICDQVESVEDAKKDGRGIVKREIVRIVSKGTFVDVSDPSNNFVLAISKENEDSYHFFYHDLGTGECFYTISSKFLFYSTLARIDSYEIICDFSFKYDRPLIIRQIIGNNRLDALKYTLEVHIKNMGYTFNPSVIQVISSSYHLKINESTFKSLEIFEDSAGKTENSLFKLMDYTKTAMGKRVLKSNLSHPLANRTLIEQKQECVSYFLSRSSTCGFLKIDILDISKMLNRISNIKELRRTCENIKFAIEVIDCLQNPPLYLQQKILTIRELNIHKEVLDVIRMREDDDFFDSPECRELLHLKQKILAEIFDLPSRYNVVCRVKDNDLSGFFIECNKKTQVPHFFTKIRDLQNGVRYITTDLIRLQDQLNMVDSKLKELEKKAFDFWKIKLYEQKIVIEKLSFLIGEIDFFQSCSIAALKKNYVKPTFSEKRCFLVEDGRHPVISNKNQGFINNNTDLSCKERIYLLTGPNMGGKSTYLRQNALFIIMAQCGMFVPCKSLYMFVFDCLFVRVGSGDNISENQSTFMVEMKQCAEMLENSSEDSMLILDEVGRGTSTKDGISISCAILEHIHNKMKCFAIISTHYIEMAHMLQSLEALRCKRMRMLYSPIKFLYAVENGIVDESFGIHVAEIAGINSSIVKRSQEIMNSMELKLNFIL